MKSLGPKWLKEGVGYCCERPSLLQGLSLWAHTFGTVEGFMTSGQVETARRQGQVAPKIGETICRLGIQEKPNLRETVIEAKYLFY